MSQPSTMTTRVLLALSVLLPAMAAERADAAAERAAAMGAAPLHCWTPKPPKVIASANLELPPHPRLRVNDDRLADLNRTIQTDATARAYFEGLRAYGETLLAAPPADCTAAHMSNTQARTTLDMEYSLGLLYRLTHDERFAARAAAELLHVTSKCTTWDPWGLALAEMVHAVGIGFDWQEHPSSLLMPHRAMGWGQRSRSSSAACAALAAAVGGWLWRTRWWVVEVLVAACVVAR